MRVSFGYGTPPPGAKSHSASSTGASCRPSAPRARSCTSTISGRTLLVLDAASLKPVRSAITLGEQVLAVVPNPVDGSVLAFAHDGAVLRVDPESGDVVRWRNLGRSR